MLREDGCGLNAVAKIPLKVGVGVDAFWFVGGGYGGVVMR